jgi:hypothetical protein
MTNHLSPTERVDALDGILEPRRQAHVESCLGCQQELSELRDIREALMVTVDDDVPEPSPLFWDHFEARVSAAVDDASAATVPWWRGSTRAWLTLATAAAVVLAVWISPLRTPVPDSSIVVETEVATIGDSVQWQFVSSVLGSLEQDDVRVVLEPSRVAIDSAFESLSADERDAFAQLLRAEISEGSYE